MILFPQSIVGPWSEESAQGSTLRLCQRMEGGFSSRCSQKVLCHIAVNSLSFDQRRGCHRENESIKEWLDKMRLKAVGAKQGTHNKMRKQNKENKVILGTCRLLGSHESGHAERYVSYKVANFPILWWSFCFFWQYFFCFHIKMSFLL